MAGEVFLRVHLIPLLSKVPKLDDDDDNDEEEEELKGDDDEDYEEEVRDGDDDDCFWTCSILYPM